MGNPRCSWVRDRLPLLAGGELLVSERRRVERHLIGCARCRAHRVALAQALTVLHAAAEESPADPDAPSLWPELARQIRESRRPVASPSWLPAWPRFEPRLAFGLGLGLLAALGVAAAARHQLAEARASIAANSRPIAPAIVPDEAPAPVVEESAPGIEPAATVADVPMPETVPPSRLNYDLDHGTPMGPELREGKQPTY